VLNDRNAELMNCYRVVQHEGSVAELLERLRRHARHVMDRDYYYRVRAWDREADFLERRSPVERAARTLFLNHTCYNGLYRLNRKGQFNVPYGKWARPPGLFDEGNLWACHRALQDVELRQESFEHCLDWATRGDFVYLDPPYHPVSRTASFTTYTGFEFRERDQRRLAEVFGQLDARGCLVMLSNSATPLIRRLYRGYRTETVLAGRSISCRGKGRGKIEELVVMNY
jgi:DNA adenine methylase